MKFETTTNACGRLRDAVLLLVSRLRVRPRARSPNGSVTTPTASPSLLVQRRNKGAECRCHFFIRDGHLHYLADCTHALAGQTVPMTQWSSS